MTLLRAVACVLVALTAACESAIPPLAVTSVEPTTVPTDRRTTLFVQGSFYTQVGADLGSGHQHLRDGVEVALGDWALDDAEVLSQGELSATVAPGAPLGVHDLVVRDELGREAVLRHAVHVVPPDEARPVVTITRPDDGARLLPGEVVDVSFVVTDEPPGLVESVEWRVFGATTARGERRLSTPLAEYYSTFTLTAPVEPSRRDVVVIVSAEDDAPRPNQGSARLDLLIDECQIDAECDDGVFCNGRERCVEGACLNGAGPICDDDVPCTVDACDEHLQVCTHVPDDERCDDGRFCNGVETCDPHIGCVEGEPPCHDGVECTIDFCEESPSGGETGHCSFVPDDSVCDDGVFCNGREWCSDAIGCVGGQNPCADAFECTETSCDEEARLCEIVLLHDLCDDGLDCTIDRCDKDVGCRHTAGTESRAASLTCFDGLDNDCDELVDGDDPDCRG